jgi:transcriptional regulator with XRE-family HTH domain
MDIGALIRKHRKLAGITQQELARRTGIAQPNIARIERGDSIPKADTFERLLDACETDLVIERRGPEPSVRPPAKPIGPRQIQVLRFLARRKVRCVLIGTLAERLHGSDIVGEDVEVVASSDVANRRRLARVRESLARRLTKPERLRVRFTPPRPLTFRALEHEAELLETESGSLLVASVDHLIAMRRARRDALSADAAARLAVVRRRGAPAWATERRLSRGGAPGTLPRR